MPYIPDPARRAALDAGTAYAENVGELNYRCTRILDTWLSEVGVKYTNLNRAIGEVEAAHDWAKLPPAGTPGRAIMDEISRFLGTARGDKTDVKGVLRCVELELYRRIAAPFEDIKIIENEDVYTITPRTTVDGSGNITL